MGRVDGVRGLIQIPDARSIFLTPAAGSCVKGCPGRALQPFGPACVGFELRIIAPGHQALPVLYSVLLLPATPWT